MNSLEIARRIIAREAASSNGGSPGVAGADLERACARVTERLRDAIGDEGHNALLARALARTETAHPALRDIRRLSDTGIHLDGVGASVATHGVTAVTTSVEALLASVFDVLVRLIGEDMAIRIIDLQDGTSPPSGLEKAP